MDRNAVSVAPRAQVGNSKRSIDGCCQASEVISVSRDPRIRGYVSPPATSNVFRLEPSLDLNPLGTEKRDHSGNYRDAICSLCCRTVAVALQVSLDALNSPARENSEIANARQIAMYLSATMFNLCASEVGRAFKRDRTTVSYALEKIEERREDAEFDFILVQLEDLLCDARHAISLCYDYFDGSNDCHLERAPS